MAMAFTYQVLAKSARNLVLQVNGVDAATVTGGTQDGSQAGIFNAAGISPVPTAHYKVTRLLWSAFNCVARLQWHATSNVDLAILTNTYGDINFDLMTAKSVAGINNNAGAGVSGDIDIFTTPLNTLTAAGGGVCAAISLTLFGTLGT